MSYGIISTVDFLPKTLVDVELQLCHIYLPSASYQNTCWRGVEIMLYISRDGFLIIKTLVDVDLQWSHKSQMTASYQNICWCGVAIMSFTIYVKSRVAIKTLDKQSHWCHISQTTFRYQHTCWRGVTLVSYISNHVSLSTHLLTWSHTCVIYLKPRFAINTLVDVGPHSCHISQTTIRYQHTCCLQPILRRPGGKIGLYIFRACAEVTKRSINRWASRRV